MPLRPGITTATRKIQALNKRLRIIQGGTSSSKTYSILINLIDMCQRDTKPTLTSIVSESFPHLKRGAIKDFTDILAGLNIFKESSWNKSDFTYAFENGSKIEFFSADQPSKVRGPRRDRLFINEANNIPFETFEQLEVRTSEFVFLDYNPVGSFWVHEEIFDKRDDYEFIILTYKDNEALPENIVKSIESRMNRHNWWKVYGLGQLGEIEGKIYTNWQIIDEIPHEARLERRGLDFGYTTDPSAIVDVYYINGGYIFDEQLYQSGLSNRLIADHILTLERPETLVIADSAEPKSIDEIYSYGVNIRGAEKGKDSIRQGIQFIQDVPISVTKRSVNLIKEYRNYVWATDKLGKTLSPNIPEGGLDHCFTGDTKIVTNKGDKCIKDIKCGELVLTSKGFNKVLLKHDNGLKQVNRYSLQTDTGDAINLVCTPDHKIKTNIGWIPISKLESGMTVTLSKRLTMSSLSFTLKKDIFPIATKGCIQRFGNSLMGIFQRAIRYTTKIKTHGTIGLKTWRWLKPINTCLLMQSKGLKKIENGLKKSFTLRVLRRLNYGIGLRRAESGILNTASQVGNTGLVKLLFAKYVGKNIKQGIQVFQNIAIKTVKLKHLEVEEGQKENVYDLTVENNHEYFANGVLVHNCLDSARYAMSTLEHRDPMQESLRLKSYVYEREYRKDTVKRNFGL